MNFRIKIKAFALLIGLSLICFTLPAQDTQKPPKIKKERKFLSRLDFGGYIGAQFGTVTLVDISPIVGYRVTDRFHTGVGFTYQYYRYDYSNAPDYSTSSYGTSVFGRYFIWRDLFAHVEYAPLYVTYYDYYYDNTGFYSYREQGNTWVHDFFIGGGYRQVLGGKAFMSLMVLFNVNETYYSPYRNPVIRIGFGVGI
jgi:hypothetical protein